MKVSTGYVPRPQFMPLHHRTERWGVSVSHVRAGKTVACINDLIDAALRCPLPSPRFAYVAPLYSQAKDVAWNYLKQYTRAIPGVVANESELHVTLSGDRRIRLYGADNYERLLGIYLDGVILDEYGDMDPRAWKEAIRARLSDRTGWAMFIGTPRGINHFADLWADAQKDPAWFKMRLRASETGILPQRELEDARKQMSEEDYQAQYECSFEASVVGSFWGRAMSTAEKEGRVTAVPYQPETGVDTWWDLGVDNMAVWFTQNIGREVHVIEYLGCGNTLGDTEASGLPGYARLLKSRPYVYNSHNAPHDIETREIGSGKSRIETAEALGLHFTLVPDIGVADGIDRARSFMSRCWFDREKTDAGRKALTTYRRVWDERRKTFHMKPHVDWTNHAADAFRYLAVGHKWAPIKQKPPVERMQMYEGQEALEWLGS